MAAKPRMMVRLAPSILHALEYIAEREGSTAAEVARSMITAASQTILDRHGWRADCQDAYMRWLSARRADDRDQVAGDIEVDDTLPGAPLARAASSNDSGAGGPYGPPATVPPLFGDQELPGKTLSAVRDEADRLVARTRPDGRKKRA